jgi:hypothetical protein
MDCGDGIFPLLEFLLGGRVHPAKQWVIRWLYGREIPIMPSRQVPLGATPLSEKVRQIEDRRAQQQAESGPSHLNLPQDD